MSANVPTPARVSTPAELDALPVGSVVRSAGGIAYTKIGPHGDEWRSVLSDYTSALMLDPAIVTQPLRVLDIPGRDLLAEEGPAREPVPPLLTLHEDGTVTLAARAALAAAQPVEPVPDEGEAREARPEGATGCDACGAPSTRIVSGGFRFCDDHGPKR